jgi:hypothetical protein
MKLQGRVSSERLAVDEFRRGAVQRSDRCHEYISGLPEGERR